MQLPRAAYFTLLDRLAHPTEIRVEAPIKSDLKHHAPSVHSSESSVNALQRQIDRFLAKDVFTRLRGFFDDLGVGIGRRADHHGLNVGIVEQHAVIGDRLGNAVLGRALAGSLLDHVRHRHQPGARDVVRQIRRVQPTDPPGTDQASVQN